MAKPLSKRIKHDFSRFRITQQMLVGIGQASHQITSRMTIWSSGYTVRSIPSLEEKEALKTGAEFIGESVVVLVSGAVIVWEYNRSTEASKAKEEKKRAQAKAEREELQMSLCALDVRLKALEEKIDKLGEVAPPSTTTTTTTKATVAITEPTSGWGWLGYRPSST
eukprot:CAMPEP_0116829560 /NCGR_PEP_ID=MMETSP0418-20121206/4283_1 /TAXON_ID=1158023 /ORGANISM="Astrosyne radiata, Strain 13vi08-1A" /LENGTH=165 /DNA_ID=CAMNT_0004458581 /DNA_START=64 /DNA_END=561 /DNA_ORIENTATION=-